MGKYTGSELELRSKMRMLDNHNLMYRDWNEIRRKCLQYLVQSLYKGSLMVNNELQGQNKEMV